MLDHRTEISQTTLKGFRFEKCIARGSSALCYHAKKISNGSSYLIKELYPIELQSRLIRQGHKLIPVSSEDSSTEDLMNMARSHFQTEMALSRQFRDHIGESNRFGNNPYFFGADDAFSVTGSLAYYVCYITQQGHTLGDLFFKQKSVSNDIRTVMEYAKLLLHALGSVHECGYLHLDVKPDNIYVVDYKDPILKMIDLGSAVSVEQLKDPTNGYANWVPRLSFSGRYSSPKLHKIVLDIRSFESTRKWLDNEQTVECMEQIAQEIRLLDFTDDLYSFFVVLYELLTLTSYDGFNRESLASCYALTSTRSDIQNSLLSFMENGLTHPRYFENVSSVLKQLDTLVNALNSNDVHPRMLLDHLLFSASSFTQRLLATKLADFEPGLVGELRLDADLSTLNRPFQQSLDAYLALVRLGFPRWNGMLVADGGFGKTTIAQQLCSLLTDRERSDLPVPIFVTLKALNKSPKNPENSFTFLFEYVVEHYLPDLVISLKDWERLLKYNRFVHTPTLCFFLDGFDEIAPDDALHIRLEIEQLMQHPGVQVVIGTRNDRLKLIKSFAETTRITVSALNDNQIHTYLRKINHHLNVSPQLLNALRTPLFLIMYAKSTRAVIQNNLLNHQFYEFIEDPKTEIEIFKNYLEYNLFRNQPNELISWEGVIQTLMMRFLYPYVAFIMSSNEGFSVKSKTINILLLEFCKQEYVFKLLKKRFPQYSDRFTLRYSSINTSLLREIKAISDDFFTETPNFFRLFRFSKLENFSTKLIPFVMRMKYEMSELLHIGSVKKIHKLIQEFRSQVVTSNFLMSYDSTNDLQIDRDIYRDMLSAIWLKCQIDYAFDTSKGVSSLPDISSWLISPTLCYHLGSLYQEYRNRPWESRIIQTPLHDLVSFCRRTFQKERAPFCEFETDPLAYDYPQKTDDWMDIYINCLEEHVGEISLPTLLLLLESSALKKSYFSHSDARLTEYFLWRRNVKNPVYESSIRRLVSSMFPNLPTLTANIVRTLNYSRDSILGEDLSGLNLSKLNLNELSYRTPNYVPNPKLVSFDYSLLYLFFQTKIMDFRPRIYENIRFIFNASETIVFFESQNRLHAYSLIDNEFLWIFDQPKHHIEGTIAKDSALSEGIDFSYTDSFKIRGFELSFTDHELLVAVNDSLVVLETYYGRRLAYYPLILPKIADEASVPYSTNLEIRLQMTMYDFLVHFSHVQFRISRQGKVIDIRNNIDLKDSYYFRDSLHFSRNKILENLETYVVENQLEFDIDDKIHLLNGFLPKNNPAFQTGKVFGNSGNSIRYVSYSSKKRWIILQTYSCIEIYDYRSTDIKAELKHKNRYNLHDIRILDNNRFFVLANESSCYITNHDMHVVNHIDLTHITLENRRKNVTQPLRSFVIFGNVGSTSIGCLDVRTNEFKYLILSENDLSFIQDHCEINLFGYHFKECTLEIFGFVNQRCSDFPIVRFDKHQVRYFDHDLSIHNEIVRLACINQPDTDSSELFVYLSAWRKRHQMIGFDPISSLSARFDTENSHSTYVDLIDEIQISIITNRSETFKTINLSFSDLQTSKSMIIDRYTATNKCFRIEYSSRHHTLLIYGDEISGLVEVDLETGEILQRFIIKHIDDIYCDTEGNMTALIRELKSNHLIYRSLNELFNEWQIDNHLEIVRMKNYYNMTIVLDRKSVV